MVGLLFLSSKALADSVVVSESKALVIHLQKQGQGVNSEQWEAAPLSPG